MPNLPTKPYTRLSANVKATQYTHNGNINYSLSPDSSTAEEEWLIPDGQIGQFAQDVLGWSIRGDKFQGYAGPPKGIHRNIPALHPDLSFLWAAHIGRAEGMATTGQRQGATGQGPTASFKELKVSLAYSEPPYDILTDDQVSNEWQRYVIPGEDSSAEFLLEKTVGFKWPNVPAAGNYANQPIPESSGYARTVAKINQSLVWVQVPDDGLYTAGGLSKGGIPQNILSALGKVNSVPFRGYPAGTILFDAWTPTPHVYPVASNVLGLVPGRVPRCWDVRFIFVWFDPPNAIVNGSPGIDPTQPRGHNLVPVPQSRLWVRALLNTAAATDSDTYWRYQQIDLNTVFQMN